MKRLLKTVLHNMRVEGFGIVWGSEWNPNPPEPVLKKWWFIKRILAQPSDLEEDYVYTLVVPKGYYGPILEGITEKEWKRRNKRV